MKFRCSDAVTVQSYLYIFPALLFTLLFAVSCSSQSKAHEDKMIPKIEKHPPLSDWPVFRGDPMLTGRALESLPERPELIWSYKTKGKIKSSPVVADGVVFIGSEDSVLYALDANSGKALWNFKADESIEASALCAQKKVFVSAVSGAIFALDATDGHLIWQYKTQDRIMGSANFIYTGNRPGLIVGSYDDSLYCFDPETGSIRWAYETESFINGTPSVLGEKIIFGGCDAKCHIVSGLDGKKLASINVGSYIAGSAAIASGQAFLGNYDGEIVCIDIQNEKVKWKFTDPETGAFVSSPAVDDEMIYAGCRDKKVYALSRENGKKIWEFSTRGTVDSSAVVCDNKVVAASKDGWLYIIEKQSGKEIWSYEIGAPISGSPAISGGRIIIGSEDGSLYVFGEKK